MRTHELVKNLEEQVRVLNEMLSIAEAQREYLVSQANDPQIDWDWDDRLFDEYYAREDIMKDLVNEQVLFSGGLQ